MCVVDLLFHNRHHDSTAVTKETILSLKEKASAVGADEWCRTGVLMYDGMTCKAGLVWDEHVKRFVGMVDFGESSLDHLTDKGSAARAGANILNYAANELVVFYWRSLGSKERFSITGTLD